MYGSSDLKNMRRTCLNLYTANILPVNIADVCLQTKSKNKLLVISTFIQIPLRFSALMFCVEKPKKIGSFVTVIFCSSV